MKYSYHFLLMILVFAIICCPIAGKSVSKAASPMESSSQVRHNMKKTFDERKALFDQMSTMSGIPWYHLAAIDQYERTLTIANPKRREPRNSLVAIEVSRGQWVGLMNPDPDDVKMESIALFSGMGRDGNGDGRADRFNDSDVLYSLAQVLLHYGTSGADFDIAIWKYYQNHRSVMRIKQFSKLYRIFGTLDLHQHAFVLPLGSDYAYRSTWGTARNYGGYRIHEGTDLFAHYGMPVRSTCYGIIEEKGWNRYGGWRVGIRDLNNVYHYYAHLSGFQKNTKEEDIVKPGDVIGWVGSSGYGKPGTQGKFPPHLHYGLYRDNGLTEWSFDPYPYLRKWEREEHKRRKGYVSQ
jgi:hypothetical protein